MNVYHIIDHEGFGTIHRLLESLHKRYKNHKIYIPYVGNMKNDFLIYFILTSVENMSSLLSENF